VAVVPAFFTHKGLLLDLPGTVLVGVRADTTGAEARARTELLARRLKAVSDPTRLAILDALRRGSGTVTELAAAFALAQPTVSNHIRVLREAGLVSDERQGNRRRLVVRGEAADELVAGLRDVLA
ncbi:MAG: ArsR/SmtB family transcription factor, partial [Gemmatimonadales bacterium]